MKSALLILLALSFTGCTHTLYNHRKDFEPTPGSGPWHKAYENRGQKAEPVVAEKPAKK